MAFFDKLKEFLVTIGEKLFFSKMRLCSFNVNGLQRYLKHDPELQQLNALQKIDILCFQETKLSGASREIFNIPNSNVYLNSSKNSSGYCGVSFMFKNIFPLSIIGELQGFDKKEEARYFESEFPDFTLINIYVPCADVESDRFITKENFLYFLSQRISKLQSDGKSVIIVGDFNISNTKLDSYYASSDPDFDSHPMRKWFSGFLIEHQLVDTFRHFHPEDIKYTCWNTYLDTRSSNCGARIDYILVSKSLLSVCIDCKILDDVMGSDHCPVVLDIQDSKLTTNWSKNKQIQSEYLNYSFQSKDLSHFFGIKRKLDTAPAIEVEVTSKKAKTQSTLLTHFNIKKSIVTCGHKEPCSLKQVIKKGPNKGRYFYCCAKPFVERCDFFQWQNG